MPAAFALVAALSIQNPPAAPAPAVQPPTAPPVAPAAPASIARDPVQDMDKLPWFARLGMRSIGIESKLPVIDRVVLVPDAGTYLAEIARWTPKARWPVLFEDESFAPRFIRAFKPAQVIRRTPVLAPADEAAFRAAVDLAIAKSWGGDASTGSIGAMRAIGLVPAGIVAASVKDPAWTAALALAAGRGEPLVWIEEPVGSGANDVLGASAFTVLDVAVRNVFASCGLRWDRLGDDLDTFTLCRNAALRVDLPSPPGGRNPQLPKENGPLSVTDALCRNQDGSRWAFAAQIFGSRERAASMAMCSLFLHRTDAWMFDGYSKRTGNMWSTFSFEKGAPILAEEGFTTKRWDGDDGTMASWRSLLPKGISADILFMNSSGNPDYFEAEPNSVAPSTDIPVLRKPLALAMTHSFSLQQPDSGYTVGGRWLDHGVYAYVGSVHEPYLPAFVPPSLIIQRMAGYCPFLIAGRQWEGDTIPQVWRIATIGDPLMTVPAPKTIAMLPGRDPAPAIGPGETDVRASARAALERVKTADPAALRDAIGTAMHDLVLTGDDAVAAQLWKLAKAKGAADAVARTALGPLFRAGTRADFTDAFAMAKEPTAEELDMLWQLWALDLATVRDPAVVSLLKANLRGPRLDMDAKVLLPAVRSLDGKVAAVEWLNGLIIRAPDPEGKRKLAELLGPG
jgi:hypothetical protein